MNINGNLSIKFMQEKRMGYGEDSAPLFLVKENSCAVGVFDGMGGSGASTCMSEYGEGHTKAYVASRIIKNEVYKCLENLLEHKDFSEVLLRNSIVERFAKEQRDYPAISKSLLRSKLIREYPTTMAIITVQNKSGKFELNSYWAGDSRNYLWTKDGFYQISKDDFDADIDPLENISKDSPLSNCLCADRDFTINHKTLRVSAPFIVLSATDGCFGYFATPMDFENVLVETLKNANDCKDWEDNVKSRIQEVTGDDISLSLIAIGVNEFQTLKELFTQREILGLGQIQATIVQIRELEEKLSLNRHELEESILASWTKYKIEYMKYLEANKSEN